jgi:hypothetical protein
MRYPCIFYNVDDKLIGKACIPHQEHNTAKLILPGELIDLVVYDVVWYYDTSYEDISYLKIDENKNKFEIRRIIAEEEPDGQIFDPIICAKCCTIHESYLGKLDFAVTEIARCKKEIQEREQIIKEQREVLKEMKELFNEITGE